VVQRANSLTGGCGFDPKPRQPFSHSRDWSFTPLPGSGWQVLFDSQHGLIGSKKIDTLQKLVARQPEPITQEKKRVICRYLSRAQIPSSLPCGTGYRLKRFSYENEILPLSKGFNTLEHETHTPIRWNTLKI
jgi:hypothetical protein